jgi:autotransporter-associated beta strand protein
MAEAKLVGICNMPVVDRKQGKRDAVARVARYKDSCFKTLSCLFAVFVVASHLQAEPVLIESITSSASTNANTPNFPYYQELAGNWGGTLNLSEAPSTPPFVAAHARQIETNFGSPSFLFLATNDLSLQPGLTYAVQVTTPTSSSQPPPGDLIVAVEATGITNSSLPATTTAFSLSGVDKWTTLGEIICDTQNPTFTFTYVSGSLSSSPVRRFYAQCIRFIPQDQTNGTRTWTGDAGASDPMWNNPTNWGGTAPKLTGDDIEFGGVSGLYSVPDGPFSVNSINFLPGAGQFRIGANYSGPLSVATTNGIANLSSTNQSFLGPIDQGAVPLIVETGTKMLTISNTFAGTAGYTVKGSGSLYLRVVSSVINPITGPIFVQGGATLRLEKYGAIGATGPGSGDVTLDGGTLQNDYTGTSTPLFLSPSRSILIGPGGGVIISVNPNTQGLTYGGVIADAPGGSGPLTKEGSGRLTFNGVEPNTFSGVTIVNGGRLVLANSSSNAVAGDLYIAGGIVQLANNDQIADTATVTVTGGSILAIPNTISDTVAKVILDSGSITGAVSTLTATNFDFRSGTNSAILAGNADLVKTTASTVRLYNTNTYTGATTVNDGKLFINGVIGPGDVNVLGGVLGGSGTVTGPVTVQNGSMLSPGQSIGTLTIATNLYLMPGSLTVMEINKSTATNDLIAGLTNVTYGGTLVITNLAGTLTTNDVFKLFNALQYQGDFDNYELPQQQGIAWDTSSLTNDGTIRTIAPALPPEQPQLTNTTLDGTNLIFSGVGGPTNGAYYVLTSTNIALPATNWSLLSTGQFDASGWFIFTNPVLTDIPELYYMLQLP